MELIGQLVYTALGLALLTLVQPDNELAIPILSAIAGMTCLALVFFFVQARGAGMIERLGMRLMKQWFGSKTNVSSTVQADIHAIHGRRPTLALCCFLHLASWVGSGVECWLTLRFMGIDIDLSSAIVIDSLLYGIRSFAFMVPNALGVQEGAYVALGSLFGVAPDVSLALSLVRRGRDIVIGIPALIAWQFVEGRRLWQPASPAE
jgi:putative membrane protein